MKKVVYAFLSLITLLSACGPSNQVVPSATVPSSTDTHIPLVSTVTPIPPTATEIPIPTVVLPVGQLTPVPFSTVKINPESSRDLKEIARYYGKVTYSAKLTKDEKFLFILDPEGVTKYNYESLEPITSMTVTNSGEDLQISDNGVWILVDNKVLLDLRNENEPKQYVLPEVLDFHPEIFVLSPDGSMIAAQRYSCPNLCEHELRIVSTKDFSVLYSDKAPTLQNVFAFSSDGTYFAVVDTTIQENPNGSTGGSGSVASIWQTSDFTKISSLPVRFPFRTYGIAFSPDNSMLAVSQLEFIDIFNFSGGEPKITIDGLCSSPRRVMFGPSTFSPMLFEDSDCSTIVWKIVDNKAFAIDGNAPDLSKIVFDKIGEYKAIAYPQPMYDIKPSDWNYFLFQDNTMLSFKDRYSLGTTSCDLIITAGTYDCQYNKTENVNNQILVKDRILAMDGRYYDYEVNAAQVNIFSPLNKSEPFYSLPFHSYIFTLIALDPINKIIIYELALDTRINRIIVRNMENDRILAEYEGETFISSLVVSEDKKYVAFCRTIGYNNHLNKDKLVVFDSVGKKIIYDETTSCGYSGLALSSDGSQLAIELPYRLNSAERQVSYKVLIFDPKTPQDKQEIEIEPNGLTTLAAAFSPDNEILAVVCGEVDVCFFDVATKNVIYKLKAHSRVSSVAFSPDGSLLALYSSWGLTSLWGIPPFVNRP